MVFNNGLILFELVFYAIAILPMIYNLWAHGKYGILGWFFLINFCMLRLIGGGLLKSGNPNNVEPGSIVSQVSLSPLFFAMFGIFHESSISVRDWHPWTFGWGMQILGHLVVISALGMQLAGAINITKPGITLQQMQKDKHLVEAGVIIFLLVFFMLVGLVILSAQCNGKVRGERILTTCVLISMPFLLLRVLYSVIGAFVDTASWNFLHGGTLAEEVVLQVIPECFIIVVIGTAGILTRRLPDERKTSGTDFQMARV